MGNTKQANHHLQIVREAAQAILGETDVDTCLYVDSEKQRLEHWQHGELANQYVISTAKNGIGCEEGSFCTPSGLHRISEKIGSGAAVNSVFVGREETGESATIETDAVETGVDQITSRILWLDGLEPDVNQGGTVDSHDRYIYIHGTNEEGLLGKAASHGCVRIGNADIVRLFEDVSTGTLVFIT